MGRERKRADGEKGSNRNDQGIVAAQVSQPRKGTGQYARPRARLSANHDPRTTAHGGTWGAKPDLIPRKVQETAQGNTQEFAPCPALVACGNP